MGNLCTRPHKPSSRPSSQTSQDSGKAKKGRSAKSHGDTPDLLYLNASDYDKLSYVYEGRYGMVYSGVQVNNNHMVALKCFGYSLMPPDEEAINQEISVLCALKGVDGIVQIQGVIQDPPTGLMPGKVHQSEYPIIVTEFLKGGVLSRKMNKDGEISEKMISRIFRQIVLALEGLHARHFIHRDLKLENLIFASDDINSPVKIVDVGSAVRIPVGSWDGVFRDVQVVGTMGYLAPESIQYFDYSSASDIWQAGCVLYSMLSGLPPFDPQDVQQVTHGRCFAMEGVGWEDISRDAKSLVKSLLVRNPKYRITIEQILEHPWMLNKDVSDKNLGMEYLTRLKHLALRQRMKNFFLENDINLGGDSDAVCRKLDSIIPTFVRKSSSLSTSEGTPSPRKKKKKKETSFRREDVILSLQGNGEFGESCSTLQQSPDRSRLSISSTRFRWNQAIEATACNSSREYDTASDDDDAGDAGDDPSRGAGEEERGAGESGPAMRKSLHPSRISFDSFEDIMIASELPELATPQVFGMFDKDQKGCVDMKEFLLTMLAFRDVKEKGAVSHDSEDGVQNADFQQSFEASIKLYFQIFDLEQTGFVDFHDLKVAVGCFFLDLSSPIRSSSDLYVQGMSRVESLMRGIEVSEDGKISFEEFNKFYNLLLETYNKSADSSISNAPLRSISLGQVHATQS